MTGHFETSTPARTPGPIVCTIDLTARSDLALRRALLLSHQTGGRLTLVHAIDPRQPERTARAQANRAYVQLLAKVDQIAESASAAVDIAVRPGKPVEVIVQVANELDADLVVLAAPRLRRFHSIVGTTAEHVLRATKRPVLVVHRDVQGNYRHVAMAVDLSSASLPMIKAAGRLGVLDHARATLLHATSPPHEGMLKSVGVDERAIDEYKHGWHDEAYLRLQDVLAVTNLEAERTRMLVRMEPAAAAIRRVLEQEQPDLLTIGASRWLSVKRLLIGSVTHDVLRTVMSDVLVIPHQSDGAKVAPTGASTMSRAQAVGA